MAIPEFIEAMKPSEILAEVLTGCIPAGTHSISCQGTSILFKNAQGFVIEAPNAAAVLTALLASVNNVTIKLRAEEFRIRHNHATENPS